MSLRFKRPVAQPPAARSEHGADDTVDRVA